MGELGIEIKPHADGLAVFVLEFVVNDKTIFSIEGKDIFIMFYICVNYPHGSYFINLSTNSSILLLRSITSGDIGLWICLIIRRAVLLSLISVACTGFILTAITASILNITKKP